MTLLGVAFFVCVSFAPGAAVKNDPSGGWLSFADFQAKNGGTITYMNATWIVPSNPKTSGGQPALWFGTQTAQGDGALVQPILKWLGSGWYIFHEIFDWTDGHDEQGSRTRVQPGDSIFASLTYRSNDNSYDMLMTSAKLGKTLKYNYKIEKRQKKVESQAYFVLEHQPSRCSELPANGEITFTDINLEVDGEHVENAKWIAKQENPKCGSKATVLNSKSVRISWDPSAEVDSVDAKMDLERECNTIDDQQLYTCWRKKYWEQIKDTVVGQNGDERFPVFQQSITLIREHNANPTVSWLMDANEFAGLSWAEFEKERLAPQECSATHGTSPRPDGTAPASIDWRDQNVVTEVKNQGSCGSCWTFSTTGAVESHYAIATKQLKTFSEQQLVDCAGAFNNHGCNGGLPSQALEYIHYAGGLETEDDYPYTHRDGKCKFNTAKAVAKVSDVMNITKEDEDGILQAVGTVGPVSIAYDCTSDFQHYKSGVYDGQCATSSQKVNHAVLVVGYGHDEKSGKDYWTVKNSWGANFGEKGYFRIVRNKNKCGLADCASYPKIQAAETVVV